MFYIKVSHFIWLEITYIVIWWPPVTQINLEVIFAYLMLLLVVKSILKQKVWSMGVSVWLGSLGNRQTLKQLNFCLIVWIVKLEDKIV